MMHRIIVGTTLVALTTHHCFPLRQHRPFPYRGDGQSRGRKQRRRRDDESRRLALFQAGASYASSVVSPYARCDGLSSISFSSKSNDDDDAANLRLVTGRAKRRLERYTRREDRIHALEALTAAAGPSSRGSDATDAELRGLLSSRQRDDDAVFGERYDPTTFDRGHVEFKRMHNEAFVALAGYCHRERRRDDAAARDRRGNGDGNDVEDNDDGVVFIEDGHPNVFYLDGPDASTSSMLINEHGYDPSSCYVANRHGSTCDALRLLIPRENLIHGYAAEALSPPPTNDHGGKRDNNDDVDYVDAGGGDHVQDHVGATKNATTSAPSSFHDVNFAAYYFDGCGGHPPHVVDMMIAALVRPGRGAREAGGGIMRSHRRIGGSRTTAVGYSLMGGNRDVVGKELDVCRALNDIAYSNGMRTRHVLDDPRRYGLPMDLVKTEGGTFTSWMLLEDDMGVELIGQK